MKTLEASVVSLYDLYRSLPKEIIDACRAWGNESVLAQLKQEYAWILNTLMSSAQRESVARPQISLSTFAVERSPVEKEWRYCSAFWACSDLGKEEKNVYNWHGQNVSQWVYAGALVLRRDTYDRWLEDRGVIRLFDIHT